MENTHFDHFVSRFAEAGTRRGALRFLAAATLGLGSLATVRQEDTEARHKRKKHKGGGGGSTGPTKGLREICTPGVDTCSSGLNCNTPTARHTCSDTVEGVDTWCCVPPGGSCTECDCCGDYSCEFDDNNQSHCLTNPEGN